jgi:hypothetical protein
MIPDKALTHIFSLSVSLNVVESVAEPLVNKLGATLGAPFTEDEFSLLFRVISLSKAYNVDVAVCDSSLSGFA